MGQKRSGAFQKNIETVFEGEKAVLDLGEREFEYDWTVAENRNIRLCGICADYRRLQ